MRNCLLLLFLFVGLGLHAQTDTLELSGSLGRLLFGSTTIKDAPAIIGKPKSKDKPYDETTTTVGTDSVTGTFYSTQEFNHRMYIDSLKTIFQFSSRDTNYQEMRTLMSMELYSNCKAKMNGSISVDKSKRTDVKKVFGAPDSNGTPGSRFISDRYRLFVNNAWCSVEFFYDGGGTLRTVFIRKM
ncbi:MAG TPA: hypothetical protein VK826_09670 [Bacteroidia bacterium]|nr:hypothetical protein [Bacteroidia bacterium]